MRKVCICVLLFASTLLAAPPHRVQSLRWIGDTEQVELNDQWFAPAQGYEFPDWVFRDEIAVEREDGHSYLGDLYTEKFIEVEEIR
jgi:hypothetical protein